MFKKILIANRGEIAIRVIRACRSLGIRSVAVASEVDRNARHAVLADELVLLDGPPLECYLSAEGILAAAKSVGADAIHPGYGFLSERGDFADACEAAGIAFIGPSGDAMRALGAKIGAKQLAKESGVPITPGYFEPGADDAALKSAASEIGYPVMLKASAGGGGRGMRIVASVEEFDSAIALARDEAVKGFGDGEMMVEKLVQQPRHIEVQLLADKHGNVACLFERECSIQRRHQKLVEEAPSPVMTGALWEKMRDASKRLALAAGYWGAGTVEFMFDESSGEFYFLEVNARLQVEHPVTELITGLDLVAWQIKIASGEKLALSEDLMSGNRRAILGHAIEVRLVAEDAANGFMPSIGPILGWSMPEGPGVRVDSGYGPGTEITRYYDSLVAKIITFGETRGAAIGRMEAALQDTHILGVKTNLALLLDIMRTEDFKIGKFDTGWMGRQWPAWKPNDEVPSQIWSLMKFGKSVATISGGSEKSETRPAWASGSRFRIARTN